MENLKRNIAIVCGGDSSEHDVSLRSAQGLYSFFDKERYNIYIVDIKGTNWHVSFEDGSVAPIDKSDFSFIGKDGKAVVFDYAYITIHGQPGENGIMQGYFDLIHLPYSTSGHREAFGHALLRQARCRRLKLRREQGEER